MNLKIIAGIIVVGGAIALIHDALAKLMHWGTSQDGYGNDGLNH